MRRSFMVAVTLIALSAVGCTRSAHGPQSATSDPDGGASGQGDASAQSAEVLCLPIVSGCGCAYACGASAGLNADGTHQVTRVGGGSGPPAAAVERWCFDSAGLGNPVSGSDDTGCKDVFYDRTPCGGECIPTSDFLGCRPEGGQCVP